MPGTAAARWENTEPKPGWRGITIRVKGCEHCEGCRRNGGGTGRTETRAEGRGFGVILACFHGVVSGGGGVGWTQGVG